MKHSQRLILGSLLTAALSLSACKQESSSNKAVPRKTTGTAPSEVKNEVKTAVQGFQARTVRTLADQCYNDICSSNRVPDLLTLLKEKSAPGPGMEDYFKKNLRPLLTEKAQNAKKLAKVRLDRLTSTEKNFNNIKLNPGQEAVVKTMILLAKAEMINPDLRKKALNSLFETDFQKAKSQWDVKKGSSYLQVMHKGKTIEVAAFDEATLITQTQSKLNNLLGGSLLNIDNSSVQIALKNDSLSTEDIEEISATGYGIRIFDHFIFGAGAAALATINVSPEDLLKLYQTSTVKKNLSDRLTSQDTMIASCEKSYYQTLNLYPQSTQLESFKEKIELVRKSSAALLTTQDPAYEKIMAASFNLPKTPTEVTKAWVNNLKLNMTFEPNEIARTANYDDATMFTLAIIYSAMPGENNYLCGGMVDLHVSDAALSTEAMIKVSWVSVRYPQLGMAIVAHELGHIVDQFSTSFGNQQICVKDKQTSPIYAGEDFADWFSSKTMLELAKNDHISTENVGCFFAASSEELSLKNRDAKDPHSSDLYRALQIHAQLGKKIPASCRALATQENDHATELCQ